MSDRQTGATPAEADIVLAVEPDAVMSLRISDGVDNEEYVLVPSTSVAPTPAIGQDIVPLSGDIGGDVLVIANAINAVSQFVTATHDAVTGGIALISRIAGSSGNALSVTADDTDAITGSGKFVGGIDAPAAGFSNRRYLHVVATFGDYKGQRAPFSFLMQPDPLAPWPDVLSDATTFASAAAALSDGNLRQVTVAMRAGGDFALPARSGNPMSVTDKLFLTFVSADGTLAKIMIPSPDDSLFMDGETLDPDLPEVATFLTTWTSPATSGSTVVTGASTAVTTYQQGYRRRARTPRRFIRGIATQTGAD